MGIISEKRSAVKPPELRARSPGGVISPIIDHSKLLEDIEGYLRRIRNYSRPYSTQGKPHSFFRERLRCRALEEMKGIHRLSHLPRLPGWWREIIKRKREYRLPPSPMAEVEREGIIREVKGLFAWRRGEWTLNVWYSRIPQPCLWRFAIEATRRYSFFPNAVYFAKCLDTAASLFKGFPYPEVWERLIQHCGRWHALSRRRLCFLLRMLKRFLERFDPRRTFYDFIQGCMGGKPKPITCADRSRFHL